MHFSRGNSTYQEIKSQRETWQATLSLIEETPTFAIEQLHNPEVIFRGCGSTYYLSLAAASVWQSITGSHNTSLPAIAHTR